jgi:hypothetical protein
MKQAIAHMLNCKVKAASCLPVFRTKQATALCRIAPYAYYS